jgi:hypothetical protein
MEDTIVCFNEYAQNHYYSNYCSTDIMENNNSEKYYYNIYIRDLFDIQINEKDGFIIFNGYYYAIFEGEEDELEYKESQEYYENKRPPEKHILHIIKKDSGKIYVVHFTKREEIEDTSQYWSDEEVGGRICLFPTLKQKIYFDILEQIQ